MKTKVTILGRTEAVNHELKKIEFVKSLDEELYIAEYVCHSPSIWGNIELICSNYKGTGFDLMFAYDNDRQKGVLFIGHFNDGVV